MSIVITFKGIAKYFHNFLNSMKFFFCAEVIHNYSKLPCNAVLLHTPMMGSQESLLFYVSIERGSKMLLNRNLYQCIVITNVCQLDVSTLAPKIYLLVVLPI